MEIPVAALTICDGRDEVLKACRNNLWNGGTQIEIKVMADGGVASEFDPIHIVQLTLDEMKAAVDVATDYGNYLLAHIYHNLSVNRCIDAGVKCVEHGFLMGEATMKRMAKEGVALSCQAVPSKQQSNAPLVNLSPSLPNSKTNKQLLIN